MFFLNSAYYIREIKERYKKSLRKNGFAVCVPKREIFVCFSCPRRMTLTPFLRFQQYKTLSALQRLLYGLRIAFTGFSFESMYSADSCFLWQGAGVMFSGGLFVCRCSSRQKQRKTITGKPCPIHQDFSLLYLPTTELAEVF